MKSSNKRTTIIWQLVLISVLCLALGLAAYFTGIFKQKAGFHDVTLKIESSGGFALITYKTSVGSIKEGQTVSTPWEQSFTLPKDSEVILTAGNPTQSGTVTCTLRLDGAVWKQNTAEAPQSNNVACAGIVP